MVVLTNQVGLTVILTNTTLFKGDIMGYAFNKSFAKSWRPAYERSYAAAEAKDVAATKAGEERKTKLQELIEKQNEKSDKLAQLSASNDIVMNATKEKMVAAGMPENTIKSTLDIMGAQDDLSESVTIGTKALEDWSKEKTTKSESMVDNTKAVTDLRKEFNALPVTKNTSEIVQSVSRLDNVVNKWLEKPDDKKSKAALDQALVVGFNKLLDPGSVVRESEFARTPEGQGLIDKYKGAVKQITTGGVGLTDANRLELINTAKQLLEGQMQAYKGASDFYASEADYMGVDSARVIRGYKNIDALIKPASLGTAKINPQVKSDLTSKYGLEE